VLLAFYKLEWKKREEKHSLQGVKKEKGRSSLCSSKKELQREKKKIDTPG